MKIENIKRRTILNQAGKDALEIEVITDAKIKEFASAPTAIIPGKREISNIDQVDEQTLNKMVNEICNKEIQTQLEFDTILDKNMKDFGPNICLPFSLAFARAMARNNKTTLVEYISEIGKNKETKKSPIPLVTIFSGGVHNTNKRMSIQNIMIAVDIHPFSKAIKPITEIYSHIEKELKQKDKLKSLRLIKWYDF